MEIWIYVVLREMAEIGHEKGGELGGGARSEDPFHVVLCDCYKAGNFMRRKRLME